MTAYTWPMVHEVQKNTYKLVTLELDRRDRSGLRCKDALKADMIISFNIEVSETQDDILKAASIMGVDKASDFETLTDHFMERFSQAVEKACLEFSLEVLFEHRLAFRERLCEIIRDGDLDGYVLEDVAIDYLEQAQIKYLDPSGPQDAIAIGKIKEAAALREEYRRRAEAEQN